MPKSSIEAGGAATPLLWPGKCRGIDFLSVEDFSALANGGRSEEYGTAVPFLYCIIIQGNHGTYLINMGSKYKFCYTTPTEIMFIN